MFVEQNILPVTILSFFCRKMWKAQATPDIFVNMTSHVLQKLYSKDLYLNNDWLYSLQHSMKGCIYSIETHFFSYFFPQLLYLLGRITAHGC